MTKEKTIGAKITILVFFGMFFLFGIAALYIAIEGAYFGYQSEGWSSVEGVIEESHIKTRKGKKSKKRSKLVVSYQYFVNDVPYRNDKARYLDNMFYSKTKKQEIVSRFPKGEKANIYYNPSNPDQAVLVKGFSLISFSLGVLLGLVFCAIGIFGFSLLRRE